MKKNLEVLSLKFLQTSLSLLVLFIQSNTINYRDFATISLISYFLFATSFLDFGTGTRFIQDHFAQLKVSSISVNQEVTIALSNLRQNLPFFISLSFVHGLFGQAFLMLVQMYTQYKVSIFACICFFFSTFFISLSSLISKIYIANDSISTLLRIQIIGVFLQAVFFMFIFLKSFSLAMMIIGLSIPNISLLIFWFGNVQSLLRSYSVRIFFQSILENLHLRISMSVQALQGFQYLGALITPLLIAANSSAFEFTVYSILAKLYTTLTGVLGTLNLKEWRIFSIEKNPLRLRLGLISRFIFGFSVAISLSICIKLFWTLFGLGENSSPELGILISWAFYAGAQLVNWRCYYFVLAQSNYFKLILSTIAQLLITFSFLIVSPWTMNLTAPAAILIGLIGGVLVISDLNFWVRKSKK